jgi:outer membrane receptor protein involved in Fe transport
MLTRRIGGRHFLTGGVEYRESFRQDQWATSVDSSEVYLDLDSASRVFAAYVQDELRVSPKLTLTAGVRRDQDSNAIGATTNLRLAAIVKPIANSSVKFPHGSAFRAPNPYELYYYTNPQPLVPERIATSEVVWDQYLERSTRLSASVFYYHALTTRELSRAKVSLTVGNLLNRRYVDPGAEEHPTDVINQQGRTIRARVAWRF